MWRTKPERDSSEDGAASRVEHSSEDTNEIRSPPESYHGSFSGVEFDVEAGPVSDRESEKDHDSALSIDWLTQALHIRERLLLKEEPQLNMEEQGGNVIERNRAPSPDYENVNYDELPTPEGTTKRGILKKKADTYEMEKYKRNAMIIFNHKDFLSGNRTRKGTMHDEESLKLTFKKFGFEVEPHMNLPKKGLLQELKTFCLKDFTQYGCVCVAIMTHGSRHGYLRAYDTRYSEHEVIECLNVQRNPTLLGKPIIFLIQACRGDEPATAVNPDTPKLEEELALDNDDHYNLPTESDMLIFHSSYIGRASARQPLKGSWFIQTLCEQIELLAAEEDFESICRAVKKEIAQEKEHNMFFNNKPIIAKQMPVMTSTLMRLLYLRKYDGDYVEDNNDDEGLLVKKTSEDGIRKKRLGDFIIQACSCDEYFKYVKKCLRLFIRENPDDKVAASILRIAENIDIGNKYVQIDIVTNLIIEYLSTNANTFKFSDVVYLGQPCCYSNRRRRREQNYLCCSIC